MRKDEGMEIESQKRKEFWPACAYDCENCGTQNSTQQVWYSSLLVLSSRQSSQLKRLRWCLLEGKGERKRTGC